VLDFTELRAPVESLEEDFELDRPDFVDELELPAEDLDEERRLRVLDLDWLREVELLCLDEDFTALELTVVRELDPEVLRTLVLLSFWELAALRLEELDPRDEDKEGTVRDEPLNSRETLVDELFDDRRDEREDDDRSDVEDELSSVSINVRRRPPAKLGCTNLRCACGRCARKTRGHCGYLNRGCYCLLGLWASSSFPLSPDYVELSDGLLHRNLFAFCSSSQRFLII
jgi:hypothetical protein